MTDDTDSTLGAGASGGTAPGEGSADADTDPATPAATAGTTPAATAGTDPAAPASLVADVLEEEAKRQAEQAERDTVTILPDDLLPGVGGDPMTLREAFRQGGVSMLTILFLLNIIDEFDRVAIAVLAPDIQDTLNVSDTVLLGVAGMGGVAIVLGAVPMAWLADRIKRTRIVTAATAFWAFTVALMGAVVNIFQFFWARVFTGVGQSNRLPVHSSLLADQYPLRARARVFAAEGMGAPNRAAIRPHHRGLHRSRCRRSGRLAVGFLRARHSARSAGHRLAVPQRTQPSQP